jgi:hypothetical protein
MKKNAECGMRNAELKSGKRASAGEPLIANKMWKIMRGLNTFTSDDMVMLAGTTQRYAMQYLSLLKRCGYLRAEGRTPSRNLAIYRLVKNSGPNAPHRVEGLIDRNTGEAFYVE